MFEIIGYVLSVIIIAIIVMVLVEYTKKIPLVVKLNSKFNSKVKKISFYQILSVLVAVVVLIVLGIIEAVTLGTFALILNSILIGLLANGLFTYKIIKTIMQKLKISSKNIEN